MRRIVTTVVAVALMGGAALSAPAVAADDTRPTDPRSAARTLGPAGSLLRADLSATPGEDPGAALTDVSGFTAEESLTTARRVLSGAAQPADPSATIALRNLWMKRSKLRGPALRSANALLARPTDGDTGDPGGPYTVAEAPPVCNTRLCIHYVPTGPDAPPSIDWVNQTLAVMDAVWTQEVDQLGYRAPVTDGTKGGGPQLDVYLKNIGTDGLYGYCVPEQRASKRTASSYCALDNDFSAAEFPDASPEDNRVVTGAHEFFHAVQYGYDYAEDVWMLESTATWMEERIATQVNDSRQYLSASPILAPYVPLDAYSQRYGFQYGSWVWWEYLSTKYGIGIVRTALQEAGTLKKDGGENSIGALQKILRKKGGLPKTYAKFAAGNLTPAANYPEGAEYPYPRFANGKLLSKKARAKTFRAKIFHLASATFGFAPKKLRGKKWKLAVSVNGPAKRTSPQAVVIAHLKNGKRQVKLVKLNSNGDGRTKVSFDGRKVIVVSVTLVNASTRYRCNRGTALACQGKPLDDKQRFSVTGRVTK